MKKQLVGLVLMVVVALSASAQSVTVRTTTDAKVFHIMTDGGIYFSGDSLIAAPSPSVNDVLMSYALNDVVSLTFKAPTTAIAEQRNAVAVTVSPNPAKNVVAISGLPEGSHAAKIYSVSGVLVGQVIVSDGETIDISQLPEGVYLLTVANTTAKIVKR